MSEACIQLDAQAARLLEGIKIIEPLPNVALNGPRVSLSDGTCVAQFFPDISGQYGPGAIVPRRPWRTITNQELDVLIGSSFNDGQWIRVVRVPETILTQFKDIREAGAEDMSEIEIVKIASGPRYQFGLSQLLVELEAEGGQPRQDGAGINTRPPGLVTCTVNSNTGMYTGMHVDTFFSREVEQRSSSPIRICINLGAEDRFLLFVNLPLMGIRDLLKQASVCDPRINDAGRGLASTFFEVFPNYPVVKVRIAPGEAYIAPTENMIHDGCTDEKRLIDVTLTVLGHISPETFAAVNF